MEKITFKAISKHVLPRWRPQRQPSEPSYFRQALQVIFFSAVLGGEGGGWRRAQFPAEDLTPFQLVKLPGLVPVPCSPLGAAEKQRGWVVETPTLQPSRQFAAGNQPENQPGLGAWQLQNSRPPTALLADLRLR